MCTVVKLNAIQWRSTIVCAPIHTQRQCRSKLLLAMLSDARMQIISTSRFKFGLVCSSTQSSLDSVLWAVYWCRWVNSKHNNNITADVVIRTKRRFSFFNMFTVWMIEKRVSFQIICCTSKQFIHFAHLITAPLADKFCKVCFYLTFYVAFVILCSIKHTTFREIVLSEGLSNLRINTEWEVFVIDC